MTHLLKQHLFWGLILAGIVAIMILSRGHFGHFVIGFPGDIGIGAGIGNGGIILGLVDYATPGIEIDWETSPYSFVWWFRGEFSSGEKILIVPLWLLAPLPVVFWVRSVRKVRRIAKDHE